MSEKPSQAAEGISTRGRVLYLLSVVGMLAIGLTAFVWLRLTRPEPQQAPQAESGRLVRYFPAEESDHRIAVTAYGTSRPATEWVAVAEVGGRTKIVHPRFEDGELLPAGTVLVEIDPADFELIEQRFSAEARAKAQQLAELDQSEKNLREILKLQGRQLQLADAEYERIAALHRRDAVPQGLLDDAESAKVAVLTAVQRTRNSLALFATMRARTEAARDAAIAQERKAERDLEKCIITLPLDARCTSRTVEASQYVAPGERLGRFVDVRATEVVAMLETRQIRNLFPTGIRSLRKVDIEQVIRSGRSPFQNLRVPVEVTWGSAEQDWIWAGRVTRIAGSLDPTTQTVPFVIEVPDPYKDLEPGVRPPLVSDVFCEVTLYGDTMERVIVVPRDALHDGEAKAQPDGSLRVEKVVYLLRNRGGRKEKQNKRSKRTGPGETRPGKLHIQPVTVLVMEKERAVISSGLRPGDRVILTDLSSAGTGRFAPGENVENVLLRGRQVRNPVVPRTTPRVAFPPDFFDPIAPAEVAP